MRKVLVLIGRYLPGYKDGGPIRTWINVTEALGDEYEFHIVTQDRDRDDEYPYPNIQYDTWNTVGKAKVWYVKPGQFTAKLIRTLARDVDVIYSCGFYDNYGYTTLLLNRFGKLGGVPVVVAPMGTFSQGAIAQKSVKKKVFIGLLQVFGLLKNIRWSVTSPQEEADLKRHIHGTPDCVIAEDLPRVNVVGRSASRDIQTPLRVLFLSRICTMKNLLGAIDVLKQVTVPVAFSIYGPAEDVSYWEECQKRLATLPDNVRWSYEGVVHTDDVQSVFQQHDVFLFPTLGENYGHVIFEALSAGCIPVISDQTPWQAMADRRAGFVLPLDDLSAFARAIEGLANLETDTFATMADNAVALAQDKVDTSIKNTGYRTLFD